MNDIRSHLKVLNAIKGLLLMNELFPIIKG